MVARSLPLLAVLLAAVSVQAHPHSYVQGGVGDATVVCSLDRSLPGVGGACIDGGHIPPAADNTATISISDFTTNPVSAFYCQDINANGICGEGPDHFDDFCNAHNLKSPDNWAPSVRVLVRVAGPVFGLPTLSACPGPTPRVGTFGSVLHAS